MKCNSQTSPHPIAHPSLVGTSWHINMFLSVLYTCIFSRSLCTPVSPVICPSIPQLYVILFTCQKYSLFLSQAFFILFLALFCFRLLFFILYSSAFFFLSFSLLVFSVLSETILLYSFLFLLSAAFFFFSSLLLSAFCLIFYCFPFSCSFSVNGFCLLFRLPFICFLLSSLFSLVLYLLFLTI